jgi:hypothetical protein
MVAPVIAPGQIWRDDCYYLDRSTGECKRKYFLVLGTNGQSDALTAVFTSKPNGLTEHPACNLGPPRAGYFVGVPGGFLNVPTWVDFNSLNELDTQDLGRHVASGRSSLTLQTLPVEMFCGVLRCLLQSDDVTRRQAKWLADVVGKLDRF